MMHVQGHTVKYSNHNNSAIDCSILLNFGTEFDHGTTRMLQMFKVKGQKSRSQHNIMYQQLKYYEIRWLNDFKLGMGVVIKLGRDWRDVGRPSSCNAFAIAMLSS